MSWQKIALLGVGLLGGSLGLAIQQRRLAKRVEGCVRRLESVAECQGLGIVDHATLDLSEAVRDADLVILCTPLAQMRGLVERALPALQPGAIVTDVGSVKGVVIKDLEPLVAKAGAHFVGSHPMAGAEKMGAGAARADLFHNAVCILTPTANTEGDALQRVDDFWRQLGSRTLHLSPDKHDEYVARCSHLPHVIAATLANLVLGPSSAKELASLCATGFRDTTRIASGSPEMWRDIALANHENLAEALARFQDELRILQRAVESQDAKALDAFLSAAKQRRDQWGAQNASLSPE
ncbi:MAG: prephenate dehydrogenase/arogenate dehydrogenase family protein [Verrucomicrobia bacterium]|nr:prephenate dehydrogenase/arogenate dehydrogenase family protein [Verrucomicrobiota bacterium]